MIFESNTDITTCYFHAIWTGTFIFTRCLVQKIGYLLFTASRKCPYCMAWRSGHTSRTHTILLVLIFNTNYIHNYGLQRHSSVVYVDLYFRVTPQRVDQPWYRLVQYIYYSCMYMFIDMWPWLCRFYSASDRYPSYA